MSLITASPISLGSGFFNDDGEISWSYSSVCFVENAPQRQQLGLETLLEDCKEGECKVNVDVTDLVSLTGLTEEDVKLLAAQRRDSTLTSMTSSSESSTASICSTDDDTASERSSTEDVEPHLSRTSVVPMSDPDVYGQKHPIETDSLIDCKLLEFDLEVNQLSKSKSASVQAAEQNCQGLLTRKFKLMFLRCECFNVEKAAKRYAKYWEKRIEIFGPSRAFQPFTLESMTKSDMLAVERGALQVIRRPKTSSDDDERDMMYMVPSKLDPTQYTREAGIRGFWYYFHCLIEDEQVQKRGMIVLNDSGNFTNKNRDPAFIRMCITSMQGCLPIRFSSLHACHVPPVHRMLSKVLLVFLGDRLRKRVQVHCLPDENFVNLIVQKYSIPRDCIPEGLGGDRKMELLSFLAERRADGM